MTPDPEMLARLVDLALAGVTREYPNQPQHVWRDHGDDASPRDLHPAFYGCYDWHSAVHAHWTLVRAIRFAPSAAFVAPAVEILDAHLSRANLHAERAYFQRPTAASFERPYGWAWLMSLMAETASLPDNMGGAWHLALQPLHDLLRTRLTAYLDVLPFPVRSGVHSNTAFALALMLDAARSLGDAELESAIAGYSRGAFSEDSAWAFIHEPSGEDFVSPGLCEADLMRRVLEPESFAAWFDRFASASIETLMPLDVTEIGDGRLMHLAGLNLTRAWMLNDLPEPWRSRFAGMARAHHEMGMSQVFTGDFAGEHWLATFALRACLSSPS